LPTAEPDEPRHDKVAATLHGAAATEDEARLSIRPWLSMLAAQPTSAVLSSMSSQAAAAARARAGAADLAEEDLATAATKAIAKLHDAQGRQLDALELELLDREQRLRDLRAVVRRTREQLREVHARMAALLAQTRLARLKASQRSALTVSSVAGRECCRTLQAAGPPAGTQKTMLLKSC
jgi:hypothetical protein